jgi:hypothetical protein
MLTDAIGSREYKIRSETGKQTEDGKMERKDVKLTIDWTGVTDEEVMALAELQAIVRFQNANRNVRILNDTETVKGSELIPGRKVKVKRPEDMTVEELLAIVERKKRQEAGFDA